MPGVLIRTWREYTFLSFLKNYLLDELYDSLLRGCPMWGGGEWGGNGNLMTMWMY